MSTLNIVDDVTDDVKYLVNKVEDFVSTISDLPVDVKDFERWISEHSVQILQFISHLPLISELPESVVTKIFEILHLFVDKISQNLLSIDKTDTLVNDIVNLLSPTTPYIQSIGKKLYDLIPDNMTDIKSLIHNITLVTSDELHLIITNILNDIDSVVDVVDKMKSIQDVQFISSLFNQLGLFSVIQSVILQIPVLNNIAEGLTFVIVIASLTISAYKSGSNQLHHYVDLIFGEGNEELKTQVIDLVAKYH
jgi:DNA-directed RNA polymerase subunit F